MKRHLPDRGKRPCASGAASTSSFTARISTARVAHRREDRAGIVPQVQQEAAAASRNECGRFRTPPCQASPRPSGRLIAATRV